MPQRTTRRRFLQHAALAGVAGPLVLAQTRRALAASDKLNVACIGVAGKGDEDSHGTFAAGHNIVALCDVDTRSLDKAAAEFKAAKRYTDWRKMLEQKDIDAVTISTPDHTHAPATYAAMKLGKHVYTQKPLTNSVFEARRLAEVAAETGVVTQMGIQHHATARLKIAVQIIRDGVIGKVREVHTWTDRPGKLWPQGQTRPDRHDPVPSYLDWNQWLGVAPERPYVDHLYHPFVWRGWWDFGTGALGDMGCHIIDPVFNALELPPPKTVSAEGPPPLSESPPTSCVVHWEFQGAKHSTDTLKLSWYENGKLPPRELFQAPDDWKISSNAVLFVGEKGNLFVGFPEMPELFPKEAFANYKMPELMDHDHYQNWTDAILGKGKPTCPFSYSGPLTETVLLGNVAYRSGKKIVWNSEKLEAVGAPEAAKFIRREYRDGWKIEGLG